MVYLIPLLIWQAHFHFNCLSHPSQIWHLHDHWLIRQKIMKIPKRPTAIWVNYTVDMLVFGDFSTQLWLRAKQKLAMQRFPKINFLGSQPPSEILHNIVQSLDLARSELHFKCFWITKINQSTFELSESKEKVSQWVGRMGTHKLALLQTLSLTTESWLSPKGTWHVTPEALFLCRPLSWSVYVICFRPKVASDAISGQNIKTIEG